MSQVHTVDDHSNAQRHDRDSEMGLDEVFRRLRRGLAQVVGLALIGFALSIGILLLAKPWRTAVVSTRVTFAFDGLERGEYPDGSKFQADDLRAPDLVLAAFRATNSTASETLQSRVRSALSIEPVVPPEVTRQRDKIRASGTTPPVYVPDEYALTLDLPYGFPISMADRKHLLIEIVTAYREKFVRTYGQLPMAFGTVFASLEGTDYLEYEMILNDDVRGIIDYLTQLQQHERTFRSTSTNLSFGDLVDQARIFMQVRLTETLGEIRASGLSRDRHTALIKLNYFLQTVEDRVSEAVEEEKTVKELLAQAQDRNQSYVLGLKTQAADTKSSVPLLDQGLIDSLVANDSYNFLVRRALDASHKVTALEVERSQIIERRKVIEKFMEEDNIVQETTIKRVNASLLVLEVEYKKLINAMRETRDDYVRQKFSDVVRFSAGLTTSSLVKDICIFGLFGIVLGGAIGSGAALLNIYWPLPGSRNEADSSQVAGSSWSGSL